MALQHTVLKLSQNTRTTT